MHMDLPMDAELRALMERVDAGEVEAVEEWRKRMGERDARFIAAMGRDLASTRASIAQAREAFGAVMDEYEAAIARLVDHAERITETLESIALLTRTETGRTSIIVPYVGKVTTRSVPGKPSVTDPAAVMAFLSGSEREAYMKPQPDALLARDVLSDIEQIAAAHGVDKKAVPGVQWGDDKVTAKVESE